MMGMYDTMMYKGREYQTKSLECLLEEYRITADGRLVTDAYKLINCPLSEQTEVAGMRLPLFKKVITKPDVDTNYHGWLNFYGEEDGYWVDYYAKFTDGELVEIDRRVGDPLPRQEANE